MKYIINDHTAFLLDDEDKQIGKIDFHKENDTYFIDYTFVKRGVKKYHIKKDLMELLVKKAREEKMKVTPICPLAKTVFGQVPEFADVFVKEQKDK